MSAVNKESAIRVDILIIGGGTAGTVAAIKAKEALPDGEVLLLEKANVMAYHAGAELTNIECFQVNPLLKDYNGPACAYVSGPFGGYTVNAKGNRFMLSDYWSGQMMWEFYRELNSANGPVFLKMDHLAPETVNEIEQIVHTTERPSRGRFHAGRGVSYGSDLVEMAISEIGLCSGHSASGVWVNERGGNNGAGPVCCGGHGLSSARLHARRLHLRENLRAECC